MNVFKIFMIVTFTLIFMFHCNNDSKDPAGPTNTAPLIKSITSSADTIKVSGLCSLTCDASDADGDNISYVWNATAGTIITTIGNQQSVTWQAPNTLGTYKITCTVLDGNNGIDSASVEIDVLLLPISTSGLIGYWPMNGNADDESGYANHGSPFMAILTSDRDGNNASAYRFLGNDEFINMGNSAILKPQLPVTIAFWLKSNVPGRNHILSTNFNATHYFGFFMLIQSNGKLNVGYGDGEPINLEATRSKLSTDTLNVDTWYHVAGVFRGETDMDIFINGIDSGGTYSGFGSVLDYDNGNFNLGRLDTDPDNDPQYFDGVLDEVVFFNRALTAREVQTLFQTNW